ncbi:hypothetical protein [Terrimonas pollutisoli]|uniref:hypothetical protein n=1 Tax=Terrimonas pollutisoli TaxID=3034147 RepID=UPI0023ED70EA|nr:hypothetical protein [Terrimonas sp. H1YJ31]
MKLLTINRFSLATIILSLSLFFFSCKKESSQPSSPAVSETEAAEYSAEGMETEASYDDVQDISMTAADEEGILSAGRAEGLRPFPFLKLRVRIGAKAVITVTPDDITYPKTVTIDFGEGYICPDAKFRKGKIVLHFTGPLRQPGSVVTITLVDFQVGRVKVEGTKVITNLSENDNIKFSVVVTGGKVTFPNGRGYTYEKIKYVKQIAGAATTEIADNIYSIEGESKTTFKNGVVITLKTVDALIKKVSCAWISEGTLKMTIGSYEFLLDYTYPNNGDCDNKALLKWNNKETIILLP